MRLVKCKRCDGTGEYVPINPPHPGEVARYQEWLRAEEEFITGIKPVVNEEVSPPLPACVVCHGFKKVPIGGVL